MLQEANESQEKKANLEKQLHQVETDIENLELKLAVLTKKIYSTNMEIKQKRKLNSEYKTRHKRFVTNYFSKKKEF